MHGRARRSGHCAAIGAALGLAFVAPAAAQGNGGGTAPAYPGNTLAIEETAPIVAGQPTTVRLSGRSDWGEPTDVTTIPYSLYLYVQNADVDANCEPSYGAQLQKSINIPTLGASETLTDFVLSGDLVVDPEPPAPSITWAGESLPFVVTPGIPNVLLCGYVRYVTDDVAYYQLSVLVAQPGDMVPEPGDPNPVSPRCGLVRQKVARGNKLRVRCEQISSDLRIELDSARGVSRTLDARVNANGVVWVPTRSLRRGTYRVTLLAGGLIFELGTVRIR